jgi:hypothetical protein
LQVRRRDFLRRLRFVKYKVVQVNMRCTLFLLLLLLQLLLLLLSGHALVLVELVVWKERPMKKSLSRRIFFFIFAPARTKVDSGIWWRMAGMPEDDSFMVP